ncbi:MAG: 50S ribosomal protein L25/general stress protein Ctc [Bacteroidaceae bacterium]|jgi:large subunit ribosomal protein L25|nr:50S ribosomal protein L25/general stress protein Ctc [Bacteroidaceae bacterium]
MKSYELNGSARTIAERSSEQTKALKAMRRNNMIPCVLYGGEKNVNFSVNAADVRKLVYSPDIHYVNLNIDGVAYVAIIREIQFHPVKDNILHIDFLEINDQKPIVMEVPLKLEGLAVGVKAGGKMRQLMRTLRVKALYTNIPESLSVDVSDMGLGKARKIADLSYENLELINPKTAVVCMVAATRQSKDAAAQ